MPIPRREFLQLVGGGVASVLVRPLHTALGMTAPAIRAVAFDAFTIFDPRPLAVLADKLFPGKGVELSSSWRVRQFEYTWLRTLAQHYVDFWTVTDEALVYAAKSMKLDLVADKRRQLMEAYLELPVYADVAPALRSLRDAGIRLAFLSNMTVKMLSAAVQNSGLDGLFERTLSSDVVQAYKPDPRAYQMAIDAFGLPREEIAFAAFAGWDAAGAKYFGYPTFWVNRANAPAEELGASADASGAGLADLVSFVLPQRAV